MQEKVQGARRGPMQKSSKELEKKEGKSCCKETGNEKLNKSRKELGKKQGKRSSENLGKKLCK